MIPATVGVTVGLVRTGVGDRNPGGVGVRAGCAGDGVTAGLVGTTTNGVNLGSRPLLGAFREMSHSRTMTRAETIDATAAPKSPRRVVVTCGRLSSMGNRLGGHVDFRCPWNADDSRS